VQTTGGHQQLPAPGVLIRGLTPEVLLPLLRKRRLERATAFAAGFRWGAEPTQCIHAHMRITHLAHVLCGCVHLDSHPGTQLHLSAPSGMVSL
jgi:hypothetical protein